MAPPTPATSPLVDYVLREALRLSDALAPATRAYHSIWLEGQALNLEEESNKNFVDPLYGKTYLPRKFKTAFAIPPLNDIDVFTNDLSNCLSKPHTHDVLEDVDIERAFHTKLRVYRHPNEARTFYSPEVEPSLDSSLPVLSVAGLDDFFLPRPMDLRTRQQRMQTRVLAQVDSYRLPERPLLRGEQESRAAHLERIVQANTPERFGADPSWRAGVSARETLLDEGGHGAVDFEATVPAGVAAGSEQRFNVSVHDLSSGQAIGGVTVIIRVT
jgi:hypothetical protein